MPLMVWVEIGDVTGLPIRIFKNQKTAALRGSWDLVAYVLRSSAVSEIRRQIWERAKKRCEHCGAALSYGTMEMHEELWRGRGGEISLANGRCLCNNCHSHDKVAGHGKRMVRFGESSKQV